MSTQVQSEKKPSEEATKLATAWIYGPVASAADSVNPRVVALAQFLDDAFASRDEQARRQVEAGRACAKSLDELSTVADDLQAGLGSEHNTRAVCKAIDRSIMAIELARSVGLLPKES